MDNTLGFDEWLSRFCERWNSLHGVKKINKNDIKQGFLFRQLFEQGHLFFLTSEKIAHNTPEEAAENLRADIINGINGERMALQSNRFCA